MDHKPKTRIENLEILWNITKMLHTSGDLQQLVEMALSQAMNAVNAEAGTLWLNDINEDEYLYPAVVRGPKADGLKGLKLKRGQGLAGWVAANAKPQLISDVRKDERWSSKFDQSTGYQTISLLCVPLVTQASCIGCLQLVNKRDHRLFDEDDLNMCEALAGIIAIAVENSRLYHDLKLMFKSFLVTLTSTLDARDPYTKGHSERVSEKSLMLGKVLGLADEELETLERAALLHDIGKIGISDGILLKQAPLNDEEFSAMRQHPDIGKRIIQDVQPVRMFTEISQGTAYHHERYDGKGYPFGMTGQEIPLIARIIAIADTFDAMTSDRPYRKGLPTEVALQEIERCAGTQFDPQLVDLFISQMRNEVR